MAAPGYRFRIYRVFLICAFFIGFFRLEALPFTVISPGDPVLEDLRFLVRESGLSFRSFTPPLSRDEVQQILEDIDEGALSDASREAWRRVQDALAPPLLYQNGVFGLSAHIRANPEIHIRTNNDIPFSRGDTEAPQFLVLPLNFYFADTVQLVVEPLITADPTYYTEKDAYWGSNVVYDPDRFDMNMPLRAFIAAGGPWWNFQLGRDRVSYGVGHTGNLAISDNPDYYDFARLSFFSKNFKYSLFMSQLPMNITELIGPARTSPPFYDPDTDLQRTTNRYMYMHRVDARLFKRLSIGLSEGIMAGDGPPEIRFMNPFVLFHSLFAWNDYDQWGDKYAKNAIPDGETNEKFGDMVGSIMSLDIEWAIIPSLALYGQFVMNEFASSFETGHQNPPDGLGFLAGVEHARSFKGWRALIYGEFVYTEPYVYTLSTPFSSFIWMRKLSDNTETKKLRYLWIGHPEGRDAILFALGAGLSRGNLGFSLDLSFINKGEHGILWDWVKTQEAREEGVLSGRVEHKLAGGFETVWKPISLLTLSGYIGGAVVLDADHVKGRDEYGLEFIFSAAFSY
ncbi:hypothetical protein TREPR_2407 [Treponema primitia ZAS-2]|uniref:Capsule assembly Wzi family protein n=1 Tax=Treponema primitia (strain ATCC BAA-887 / DSM 12427 / ZAS-2) TaxID=545694 RepID=F5YHH2_TREPZ|nr:capsule assembly Wzi family protein [Treponema primitia]AEF87008.1 hypothetical protein TREPR_2407 [Treponema primitia ZAS-2]